MGNNSSVLSREVCSLMGRVVAGDPAYKREISAFLRKYQKDPTIPPADALQWTAERLIKDFLDPTKFGGFFVPALNRLPVAATERAAVNECIASGAMLLLQEIKVDLEVHERFLACAALGDVERLKKLRPFADSEWLSENGSSALLLAAQGGRFDAVQFLLTRCHANVHVVNDGGWNVLLWAAFWGWAEIVRLCTDKGAPVDAANEFGETACILSAQNGHFAIVRHLLDLSCDVSVVTASGENALIRSVAASQVSIAKALVEAGASLDQLNRDGRSAVLLAASLGLFDLVEFLVSAGARLDLLDRTGHSVCSFEKAGKIATAIQRGLAIRIEKITSAVAESRSVEGDATRNRRLIKRAPRVKSPKEPSMSADEGAGRAPRRIRIRSRQQSRPEESSSSSSSPLSSPEKRRAWRGRKKFPAEGQESEDSAEEKILEDAEREMRRLSERHEQNRQSEEEKVKLGESEEEREIPPAAQNSTEPVEAGASDFLQASPVLRPAGAIVSGEDSEDSQEEEKLASAWRWEEKEKEKIPQRQEENEKILKEQTIKQINAVNPFKLAATPVVVEPSKPVEEIPPVELVDSPIVAPQPAPVVSPVAAWLSFRAFPCELFEGFTFSDLKSLERQDAWELLGRNEGERLRREIASIREKTEEQEEEEENHGENPGLP